MFAPGPGAQSRGPLPPNLVSDGLGTMGAVSGVSRNPSNLIFSSSRCNRTMFWPMFYVFCCLWGPGPGPGPPPRTTPRISPGLPRTSLGAPRIFLGPSRDHINVCFFYSRNSWYSLGSYIMFLGPVGALPDPESVVQTLDPQTLDPQSV